MIKRLTPGVLLPPDHRHEFKILIHITLLDMITITVIDHGMSLSVLYFITLLDMTTITVIDHGMSLSVLYDLHLVANFYGFLLTYSIPESDSL